VTVPGSFLVDEAAATAIEYALIASLISIVILATALAIGTGLHDTFYDKIGAAFQ
jgi:Flp pilus assembly pilin Flp